MRYLVDSTEIVKKHIAKNHRPEDPTTYELYMMFASLSGDNWSVLIEAAFRPDFVMAYHVSYDASTNQTTIVTLKALGKQVVR